jgi:DNA-binding transcriptional MerR regulator/quercetin dioxygenase-like cupin family protein
MAAVPPGVKPELRIGDVARLLGVSPSTVRAWERKGLVQPQRGGGSHRRYRADDIARLRDVHSLLSRGYNPPALREMISGQEVPGVALVGARLRHARTKRGMTLRVAAELAGVSASYLSLVERGLAEPSVAMLQRVASAYGGTLLEFFGAVASGPSGQKLVRSGERRRLRGFDRVEIEDLVVFPAAVMEVNIFTIAPGGGSGGNYAHDGEESVFVLDGELDIWLDDAEHYHIEKGDTLYFPSTQRHRWANPGVEPARVLWVNTPPTF